MKPKSQEKRTLILSAAGQLFMQHGYNVNMEQIAKVAGVSKQTVYSHFQNKDALFEACVQSRCIERQVDQEAFDLNAPISEVLLSFAMRFQSMMLEPQVLQVFRNAVGQATHTPQIGASYLNSGPKPTIASLASYLEVKQKQQHITLSLDPNESAVQLIMMFHGKAVYWAMIGQDSQQTDAQRNEYLKDCVDLFLNQHGH